MAFNPDPSMSFSDKQEMRRRAQAAPDFVGPSMMDAQTPQRQSPPPAAASLGARVGSAPKGFLHALADATSMSGGTADWQNIADAPAQRVDQATAQAAGVAAPAAPLMDNGQPAPATVFRTGAAGEAPLPANAQTLGQRLAPGLKRYRMDAGNEHPVYVGKGAHGEVVFTDDPNQAVQKGGLQAGDAPQGLRDRVGQQLVAGKNIADPNAGFAYGTNSLQQGQFNTHDAQGNVVQGKPVNINATNNGGLNLDSASDVTSYQNAVNAAQNDTTNPETRMANLQLLNSLHARGKTFEQRAAAASPVAGMSPAIQMDMLRMRQTGMIAADASNDRKTALKNSQANTALSELKDFKATMNDTSGKVDPATQAQTAFSAFSDDPTEAEMKSEKGKAAMQYLDNAVHIGGGGRGAVGSLKDFRPGNFTIDRPGNWLGDNNARMNSVGAWLGTPFGTAALAGADQNGVNSDRFPPAFTTPRNLAVLKKLNQLRIAERTAAANKK